MKVYKITIAALLVLGSASAANAEDSGHGTVTFQGAIIDAPCSINPDSIDQTINLGQISAAALSAGGKTGSSTPRPFQIKLENCTTATLSTVQTKFTGATSAYDVDSLALSGSASGASIVMIDGSNKKVKLNVATTPQGLQDGRNTLNFNAYLQGGGSSATIVPGEFNSITNFTLAYQ
ncbi:type 1 fimbrial protein [Erwiniaceae bacterium BAC15a-03b]|uniref:Type 1 fimbrial protein n=1 Tax=Winslowiella arboricola TaxID=2978220 RepID=A0A9J6PMR0_9GAMM|nr:fimbrial protein [Winslowiella arboricola]MCU5771612.1 type 1 fimbrial protein [Winslowiella arboricola]MCU5775916.1 type 1 fimbrial protein [Winslowiella arboricola]